MIFYIILFLIILAIVIWGGVTQWRFVKKRNKEGYGKDIINIFLCTDKNQEEGLYALINSILTNLNPIRKIKFYILVDSDPKYYENKLLSQKLVKKDHLEIKEIPKGEYSGKCKKINQNMNSDKKFTQEKSEGTLNIMNLARFLSPEIFKNVRKAIYMDIDMINQHDISELFDIDLNGKDIASPLIMTSDQMGYDKSLNVPNIKMFNAGIYLFDVESWRKNDLTNKSLELMEKNSQKKLYRFNTQPVLNYFFINKVKDIDKRWNTKNLGCESSINNKDLENAFVLHWNGPQKPWKNNGLYKEYWDKYSYENNLKDYIPFTTKLKKYMKSPKMNSDKWNKYIDKVLFKDYAKSKGVDTAKILLGPFDDANEMKLKDIPKNCVIKVNDRSGGSVGIKNGKIIFTRSIPIAKGKNIRDVYDKMKTMFNNMIKVPYGIDKGEPWYSHIKPKIFVEELLDPVPPDIRFWTFNGKVGAIHITQNARMGLEHCQTYYDRNGNKIDCKLEYPKCKNQEKPENFDEMVKAAESLGEGLEFARIDLYNYNGKILAGEITFAPYAGHVEFKPKSCDIMLSNFWN